MMKKLFALLVVLALCGAANAGSVTLDDDTTIVASPGEDITIYVSGVNLATLDIVFTVTGNFTITGYMTAADCDHYGWDPAWSPPIAMSETPTSVEIGGGLVTGINTGTVGYIVVAYGGGEAILWMEGGMSWGGTYDAITGELVEITPQCIYVPEPMTIVLLALGGLFIRRRK